jgi:hypothetical protein
MHGGEGIALSPSLRGAQATKQSILSFRGDMDCFASLAMTTVTVSAAIVIAELDPAIHRNREVIRVMDARVKLAHDERLC